ncbi:azurin [Pseudomonas sp. P1B16]|jgi:azurin|uniref:azurin n=1 Tax=Pseudomonas TaxID=286 RepID=UPI000BA2EB2A|nr:MULTISPECIES: azurin [unclassified Pseudomonas]MDD2132179.1 azurin [Pseudomonas sp. 17391]UDU80018.1 azurin [Pseudomonas sp. HN2-3]UPL07314.1 Azurin [Pseudomonas sp. IsoF]WPM25381.1 azurin [Pseudomonas sp. P1B16]
MTRQLLLLALLAAAPAVAWSAVDCAVEIHGTDQMTFDKAEITVPKACTSFTVTLAHPGQMPKNVMGHNWVLSTQADMQGVLDDGLKAGEAQDYVMPGDTRVLAHTRLIGGGETDSVTLDTRSLKARTAYSFYCSFPFHSTLMKGTLALGS